MSGMTETVYEHCRSLRQMARRFDDLEYAARLMGLTNLQERMESEADELLVLADKLQHALSEEINSGLRKAEESVASVFKAVLTADER